MRKFSENLSTGELKERTRKHLEKYDRNMAIACILGVLAVIVQIVALIIKW